MKFSESCAIVVVTGSVLFAVAFLSSAIYELLGWNYKSFDWFVIIHLSASSIFCLGLLGRKFNEIWNKNVRTLEDLDFLLLFNGLIILVLAINALQILPTFSLDLSLEILMVQIIAVGAVIFNVFAVIMLNYYFYLWRKKFAPLAK